MNWHAWNAVERILLDHRIDPILGVIPDNRDNTLQVSTCDGRFWDRVRAWQARGWTIAMHGWQHRLETKDGGILRLNEYGEFAGLPRPEQKMKIRHGLRIFEQEGIRSVTWIAPAHAFDEITLQVLSELNFRYISDGFFFWPHVDRFGMTWIPQQLWSFRWRPYGIWTICFHINSWDLTKILGFEESIRKYADRISDFNAVVSQYGGRQENVLDSAACRVYRSAAAVKTTMKRLAGHWN
jgi:Uncharacterized protein conserved in bacteria (DUF2334)